MAGTRCLYDPPEQSDGDHILVTRYWPRGISRDRLAITDWLQNLAGLGDVAQLSGQFEQGHFVFDDLLFCRHV